MDLLSRSHLRTRYSILLLLLLNPFAGSSAMSGTDPGTQQCVSSSGLEAIESLSITRNGSIEPPWSNETPREIRSLENTDGRSALRADLRNWSPIAVDDFGQVDSTAYDHMELWLRASQAQPPLNILGSTGIVCPLEELISLKANTWQRLQLPLSALGYSGTGPIGRLQLKSRVSTPFTVWVSGWRLIKALQVVDEAGSTPEEPTLDTPPVEPEQPTSVTAIDLDLWQRDPGVMGEIEDHAPQEAIQVLANGSDQEDDTEAFVQALAQTRNRGALLHVPAGTFYLSAALRLSSQQVLRGAGPERTRLIFTQSLNQGIEIGGGYPGVGLRLESASKSQSRITVQSSDRLRAGSYALLSGNDSPSSQVVKILQTERRNKLTILSLEEPLNADFSGADLRLFDAAQFAGVEDLSLDVSSPQVRIGDMILLRSTANSWVRNVISRRAFGAHVFTRQSYHCEIRDSVFDDATGHHDGKQGYGVDLANSTSACLVENNSLRYLRHSILLQEGANGNIVALNYSADPRHTNFARGGPGDISFHGAANANLIEANVVERIHIGDAGAVGAGNVVFRNCLTSGPLTLENAPSTQYLAGNAIYGSDAQLKNTWMPPLPPFLPQARPYLQNNESLMDEDGIVFTSSEAAPPVALANWFFGLYWSAGTVDSEPLNLPDTLYGNKQSRIPGTPISGYWPDDCNISAVQRLRDYN